MADLKYSVEIDTGGAQRALDGLTNAIKVLAGAFAVRELIQFGDAITSLRNKLQTISPTLENVEAQFRAIAGIAMIARAPLEATGELYFRIARSAEALGISQREAAGITESLAKAISSTGLSAQEAAGPLLQLGQALQSGRFQGDELRSILEGMPVVAEAMAKELGVTVGKLRELGSQGKITGDVFVRAMKAAKDSIDDAFAKTTPTISQAFNNLKTASAVAFSEFEKGSNVGRNTAASIEYLAFMIYKLSKNVDEIIGPLGTFLKIALSIASVLAVGRILRAVGAAFAEVGGIVAGVTKGFKDFGKTISVVWGYVQRIFGKQVANPKNTILGGLAKSATYATKELKILGTGIVSLGAGVAAFLGLDKFGDWFNSVGKEGSDANKDLVAFRKELAGLQDGLSGVAGDSKVLAEQQAEAARKSAQFALNLALEAKAYHDSVKAQQQSLRYQLEDIGASEDALRMRQSLREFDERYLAEKKRLEEAIAKARLSNDEQERNSIGMLQSYLKQLTDSREKDRQAVEAQTKAINDQLAVQRLQEFQLQALIEHQQELQKVQDDIVKLTMTEMEKKYYDIEQAANRTAEAAIRAEEKIRGRKLNASEAKAYYDAARQGAEELKRANNDLYNQSRLFETGWQQALNNYLQESTDKAAQAKRVFEGFTKGIEDAFVNFAKTGKLSFKDLLNFMIEEFVRSNVRNLIGSIFGGGGSGGSTAGNIFKSIFGLASGGPAQANKPYIVGEEGPELFVPKGTGTVLPNGVGMGGNTNNTYITNNIQAVDAKSVAQLFAENRKSLLGSVRMAQKELPYA